MKKRIFILVLSFFLITSSNVFAGGLNLDTQTNDNINLDPIIIPLFSSNALDFVENASILSWLSFAGALFTVLILVFWIVRILIAGVQAVRSEGDTTKLQDSYTKLKSNFIGMGVTFLVPLVLSLVGAFFGIGTIFNWPESFQFCDENSQYRFYFEAFAKEGDVNSARTACGIN